MRSIVEFLKTLSIKRLDKSLTLIYDGFDQLSSNPFLHQLFISLKEDFRLDLIQTTEFSKREVPPNPGQLVLVISRLRKWHMLPGISQDFFRFSRIYFYDQDPWESYHDYAMCPGMYEKIFESVKPEGFLVTSSWWAEYIKNRSGLPVHFVRMGILPRYCDTGSSFSKRSFKVAFQGTVHPHRLHFYDRLRESGIDVTIRPKVPFFSFLSDVQNIGVFIYSDESALGLGGRKTPIHGLWGKCITVAGRGCFVIRNYDSALEGYGIDELPSVLVFKDEREIPQLVSSILNRTDEENDCLIAQTVSCLRSRNDWKSVSARLLSF